MKKLILLFSFIYCLSSTALGNDMKLSTPEETLDTYINALREGDLQKVSKAYHLTVAFNLPSPIKIEKYQIIEKKIYNAEQARKCKAVPKAEADDVEFVVMEEIAGKKEKYSYLLRRFNEDWKIISHSSWSQPE